MCCFCESSVPLIGQTFNRCRFSCHCTPVLVRKVAMAMCLQEGGGWKWANLAYGCWTSHSRRDSVASKWALEIPFWLCCKKRPAGATLSVPLFCSGYLGDVQGAVAKQQFHSNIRTQKRGISYAILHGSACLSLILRWAGWGPFCQKASRIGHESEQGELPGRESQISTFLLQCAKWMLAWMLTASLLPTTSAHFSSQSGAGHVYKF